MTWQKSAWLLEQSEHSSGHCFSFPYPAVAVRALPLLCHHSVRLESRDGDVAQAILDVARETPPDVVVVGKRGTGRVAGLLIGSVSQKPVSLVNNVVIVVP